jgi:UDP-N-acetylmuramate--alanine ligase
VCDIYGLAIDLVKNALVKFKGVKRRFELKGEINGVKVYDDYAHHPSEIKATLASARTKKPNKLWCVFQPHTYSRTKSLLTSFASSFYDADEVIIVDIYAAREKDTGEISSENLVEEIKRTSNNAIYMKSFNDTVDYLNSNVQEGDMILTVGAGNVYEIGEKLLGINA